MPAKKKVRTDEATDRTQRVLESPFNFFTEADMNRDNILANALPAWTCYTLLEDLEKEISEKEKTLEDGDLPSKARAELRKELEQRKERLSQIKDKPKLNKDKIYKVCGKDRTGGSLGDKIAESMFSRDDMTTGLADPMIEANRISQPCIQLAPEEMEIASGCNIRITKDGKVNRDDAINVWRTCRHYLEEQTNAELLRR